MGKLEEKLEKRYKKGMISIIVMIIIGIIFIIPGFITCIRNPENTSIEFNKFTTEYEYAKADVKYLMGPFATESINWNIVKEFYVAEGNDGKCFVIATKRDADMPIYGVDVEDEDLETLESIRVYGCADSFDTELQDFLIESFNEGMEENEKLDYLSCRDWVGLYYIDTTEQPRSAGFGMCIFGGIFLLIGIVGLFNYRKNVKNRRMI